MKSRGQPPQPLPQPPTQHDDDDVEDVKKLRINRPMTVKEFNARKQTILKLLRKNGDPLPVANVKNGDCSSAETPLVLRKRLESPQNTATLVRGYRLIVLMEDEELFTFAAQSYIALRQEDGAIVSVTRDDRFQDRTFIFVPSSRVYPGLSDEELLSGRFQLATIIHGSTVVVCALLRAKKNMSLFERRTYATSPEDAEAIPSAFVRYFPHFLDYLKITKFSFDSTVDAAVCFGMPFRQLQDDDIENIDLRSTKTNTVTKPELVSASEFVYPTPPWKFDKESWLPSVWKLHQVLKGMFAEEGAIPEQFHFGLLMEIYNELGTQYYGRLEEASRRFSKENEVVASLGFA